MSVPLAWRPATANTLDTPPPHDTTLYEELIDPTKDPDRERFVGEGTQYCLALSWELLFKIGNEVQGNSVAFDLPFYAEQA